VRLSVPRPGRPVREARATTRRVGRTFALACRLLPSDVRDDVYLLYLVFRTIDDLVDERRPQAEARIEALERWAAGGPAQSRETEVLAELDSRHRLPRAAMIEFCLGMREDLDREPIETEEELDRYCYRVAGTVGLVMTAVLGTRASDAEPHAAALGMAMQRTNIIRDIDEDADDGRTYIALETIQRLGTPRPGEREALVRDQIARAEALYEVGNAGIPKLATGRRAIAAAAAMYREILREVERGGCGRERGRAVVSRSRKLYVGARAFAPGQRATDESPAGRRDALGPRPSGRLTLPRR
jgi:15-cis-phytoene synthase